MMSNISDLALEAQKFHESIMEDECVITRPGKGRKQTDPITGEVTPPSGTEIYSGMCRIRPTDYLDFQVQAGDRAVGIFLHKVSLPYGTGTQLDDELVPTTGEMEGTRFRIRKVYKGTHLSSERAICEQVETG